MSTQLFPNSLWMNSFIHSVCRCPLVNNTVEGGRVWRSLCLCWEDQLNIFQKSSAQKTSWTRRSSQLDSSRMTPLHSSVLLTLLPLPFPLSTESTEVVGQQQQDREVSESENNRRGRRLISKQFKGEEETLMMMTIRFPLPPEFTLNNLKLLLVYTTHSSIW